MATLMVMAMLLAPSLQNRREWNGGCARGNERAEIAPHVTGLDQVEPVPLERLLDHELGPQILVKGTCGFIARDQPYDHRGRSALALVLHDRRHQAAPDAGALEFVPQIDRA